MKMLIFFVILMEVECLVKQKEKSKYF